MIHLQDEKTFVFPDFQGDCGDILDGIKVSGNYKSLDMYAARVSAMPYNTMWPGCQRPIEQTELVPVVSAVAPGALDFEVALLHDFKEALVRPLSRKIKVAREGSVCRFTLPGAGAYTFEADGFHGALHIFINPEVDYPLHGKVLHFGAGSHDIGALEIGSDTTVVIDAGAVLFGSITAVCAENVSVVGCGIIDGSREERGDDDELLPYDYTAPLPKDRDGLLAFFKAHRVLNGCLRFYRCRGVRVSGVTLRDSATFALLPAGCENVTIENVKTIGMWRYNSDGIDIFNCKNVRVTGCFLRDFDDCMVIKGICGWDDANNEDITVSRCVVWCDWGRGLEIGAETNAPEYKNILFTDCDLIHGSTAHMDIQHHNSACIHDITFRDIRAEYTKYQLSDVYQHDMNAPYTPPSPARHPILCMIPICNSGLFAANGLHGSVHGVVFENISVLTDGELPFPRSEYSGMDAEHTVRDITMRNFSINGQRVNDLSAHIGTNAFVYDVKCD